MATGVRGVGGNGEGSVIMWGDGGGVVIKGGGEGRWKGAAERWGANC